MFDGETHYRRYFLGLFDRIEAAKHRRFNELCTGYGVNVGCGLSELGDVGVDNSKTMLRQNKRPVKLLADATKLPHPEGRFDYAFCSEVLHHVDDPEAVVREMLRVSRTVVINEANIRNPVIYVFTRFLPFDKDAHFFTEKRLGDLLAKVGGGSLSIEIISAGFLGIPRIWFWGIIKKTE